MCAVSGMHQQSDTARLVLVPVVRSLGTWQLHPGPHTWEGGSLDKWPDMAVIQPDTGSDPSAQG